MLCEFYDRRFLFVYMIVLLCCTPHLLVSHVYCEDSCRASGHMTGLYTPFFFFKWSLHSLDARKEVIPYVS